MLKAYNLPIRHPDCLRQTTPPLSPFQLLPCLLGYLMRQVLITINADLLLHKQIDEFTLGQLGTVEKHARFDPVRGCVTVNI